MVRLFSRRPKHEVSLERSPIRTGIIWSMLAGMVLMGFLSQTERVIPPLVVAVFSMVGVIALAMWGSAQPDLPLYAMVAYLPFSKILVGDFGGLMMALNLTNLLIAIIFFNWQASLSPASHKRFQGHSLHVPILLLCFWVMVSFFRSVGQHGLSIGGQYTYSISLSDLKRWLDPIVLYFLYFHVVRDRQRWKTIVAILMLGVFLAALMAIREYISGSGTGSLESERVGGIAGQPNILGAFFVYYMFLFAAFWLERVKNPKYWAMLIPFLACFRAIMVTFSRGAYLAFAQGALGLAFFKNKALFLIAVGAMAFAMMNSWMLPEGIQYRMNATFKPDTEIIDVYGSGELEQSLDVSSAQRLEIWEGAWKIVQAEPWFGVGLGRFPHVIRKYIESEKFIDAHNAYITTVAECGIPALALLILTLLMIYRITVVVYKKHPDRFIRTTALGFLGGLSGLFMANMFGSRLNTTEVSGYFWILAALMTRAYLWVKEGEKSGNPEDYGPAVTPLSSPRKTIRR